MCFKPKGIIICSARATVFQASSGRKHRTGPDARLLQRRHSAMHQFLKFAVMEQPYPKPLLEDYLWGSAGVVILPTGLESHHQQLLTGGNWSVLQWDHQGGLPAKQGWRRCAQSTLENMHITGGTCSRHDTPASMIEHSEGPPRDRATVGLPRRSTRQQGVAQVRIVLHLRTCTFWGTMVAFCHRTLKR